MLLLLQFVFCTLLLTIFPIHFLAQKTYSSAGLSSSPVPNSTFPTWAYFPTEHLPSLPICCLNCGPSPKRLWISKRPHSNPGDLMCSTPYTSLHAENYVDTFLVLLPNLTSFKHEGVPHAIRSPSNCTVLMFFGISGDLLLKPCPRNRDLKSDTFASFFHPTC